MAASKPVPLVRPSFPSFDTFGPVWERETFESGQFSNFGPLYDKCVVKLSKMTGRFAIPVSTGTAAVELAIAAAQASYGHGVDVAYEAFTFKATQLAAQHVAEGYVAAMRTNEQVKGDIGVVVRTLPFGCNRQFQHDDKAQLVIDAAGGFDADTISSMPDRAFIAVSFHATKNYPIGEGGCVFLPRGTSWATKTIEAAMNFGFDSKRNVMRGWATNAKLDELRCAVLLAQLDRTSYFRSRSARIVQHVRTIANSVPLVWVPYNLNGLSQSLAVIAHKHPQDLVEGLARAGFVARRVYHPFISEDLLTYDEQRLVALPSDMTDDELHNIIVAMKGF